MTMIKRTSKQQCRFKAAQWRRLRITLL